MSGAANSVGQYQSAVYCSHPLSEYPASGQTVHRGPPSVQPVHQGALVILPLIILLLHPLIFLLHHLPLHMRVSVGPPFIIHLVVILIIHLVIRVQLTVISIVIWTGYCSIQWAGRVRVTSHVQDSTKIWDSRFIESEGSCWGIKVGLLFAGFQASGRSDILNISNFKPLAVFLVNRHLLGKFSAKRQSSDFQRH